MHEAFYTKPFLLSGVVNASLCVDAAIETPVTNAKQKLDWQQGPQQR
jgi:hypothetical protein